MDTTVTEEVIAIIGIWIAGIGLVYMWSGVPGSWVRRLDGGGVKLRGHIWSFFALWTQLAGIIAGIILRQLLILWCLGGGAGVLVAGQLARRLSGKATDQGFLTVSQPPQDIRPKAKRNIIIGYVMAVICTITYGLWAYYDGHLALWFVALGSGASFVFFCIFWWVTWSRWKKKYLKTVSVAGAKAAGPDTP
jgi:hypothetical protein